jgi:hypothetical protein
VARPCGGHPVPDDPCRACGGASRQRPDEQPADEPPRTLSALPPATRSVAPPGAAMDHLPAASGHRRSVPRSVSGIDRRTVIETSSREFGKRINAESRLFNVFRCFNGVYVALPICAARRPRAAREKCGGFRRPERRCYSAQHGAGRGQAQLQRERLDDFKTNGMTRLFPPVSRCR